MVHSESSTDEDDGWILFLMWNGELQSNQLIILRANDLIHQATLKLPITIPYGLHGSWVNS